MNSGIKKVLDQVASGDMSADEALKLLKNEPFDDIGYAKVDLHRQIRQGSSEVIYGEGKTAEQIIGIISSMKDHGQERVLITRLSAEKAAEVEKVHKLTYNEAARI